MRAISCVWGVNSQLAAEKIRSYCAATGWELVEEATKVTAGDGTLGWMLSAAERTQANRLVLPREALAELEAQYPELWDEVRGWLEDRGVSVVTV